MREGRNIVRLWRGNCRLGLSLLVWYLVVGGIKGESWTIIMTFHEGIYSGTTNQVYGNIIGSRGDCGEGLLNGGGDIPDSGYVLTTSLTCPSDIGRVKSFDIRTNGNDGADLIKLVVKTATTEYLLLDMNTSYVGLYKDQGIISITATAEDSVANYEKLTDGNLGALVEGPTATYGLLDCAARCAAIDACQAYIVVNSECELRKYKDGSSLGTKTYYRLKYLNVT